jgi:hypothetical protein
MFKTLKSATYSDCSLEPAAILHISRLLHNDNRSYWEFSSVYWIPANRPTYNGQKWLCIICHDVHFNWREGVKVSLFAESMSIRKLSYWQYSVSHAFTLQCFTDSAVPYYVQNKVPTSLHSCKIEFSILPIAYKSMITALTDRITRKLISASVLKLISPKINLYYKQCCLLE